MEKMPSRLSQIKGSRPAGRAPWHMPAWQVADQDCAVQAGAVANSSGAAEAGATACIAHLGAAAGQEVAGGVLGHDAHWVGCVQAQCLQHAVQVLPLAAMHPAAGDPSSRARCLGGAASGMHSTSASMRKMPKSTCSRPASTRSMPAESIACQLLAPTCHPRP